MSAPFVDPLAQVKSTEADNAEKAAYRQQRSQDEPINGPSTPDDEDDLMDDIDDGDDIDVEQNTVDIIRDIEEEEEIRSPSAPPGQKSWKERMKDLFFPPNTDLNDYSPSYRYTPILSAILIPFSILLEIPGLTERWYIRTYGTAIVDSQPNPVLLDVGLAFSMACGVAANIALIIRFMERKVKVMTIICVIFLTLHDVINIITVVIFGIEHSGDDGFTYGQAFWMTICSTVVSTVTNLSIIADMVRTPDFAGSGSGLTRKQRSLVIIVMILLCYLAFGALITSVLMDLNFINALYFSTITIETVGFGDSDLVVGSPGAKIFVCFYAAFGILNLALAVGLTRETVLEALEVGYRKRVHAVRQRRRTAHWRRRVSHRWRDAIQWRLHEIHRPMWVPDHPNQRKWTRFLPSFVSDQKNLGYLPHPRGMHLNLEALEEEQLEAAALEAGVPLQDLLPPGYEWSQKDSPKVDWPRRALTIASMSSIGSKSGPLPLTHTRMGKMISMLGNFALAVDQSGTLNGLAQTLSRPPTPPPPKVAKTFSQQYDSSRVHLEREEQKAFYARLTVALTLFIMFWTVGSAIFSVTESWSYGNAMYFCMIAFTTIGYGDFHPATPAGRSIFVAWALLGIGTMTILISVIGEAYSSRYQTILQSGIFDRAIKNYRERVNAAARLHRRQSHQSHHNQNARRDLPNKILKHAKEFQEQLQYFVTGGQVEIPEDLHQLLDELTQDAASEERVKNELLKDEEARKKLFALCIEITLRRMTEAAEEALEMDEPLGHDI